MFLKEFASTNSSASELNTTNEENQTHHFVDNSKKAYNDWQAIKGIQANAVEAVQIMKNKYAAFLVGIFSL